MNARVLVAFAMAAMDELRGGLTQEKECWGEQNLGQSLSCAIAGVSGRASGQQRMVVAPDDSFEYRHTLQSLYSMDMAQKIRAVNLKIELSTYL